MKTFVNKHWIKILVALVLTILIFRVIAGLSAKTEPVAVKEQIEVSTFSITELKEGMLDTFCSVEAALDAEVVSERSGKVTQVYVSDGQEVTKGQNLFAVENINERVAVQNARVSLRSAELALAELLGDNDTSSDFSLLAQTENQQNILINNARNALFNNDLRAYPAEDPDRIDAAGPTIIGNYTCSQEGEYQVEVYSSGAKSGASFRYTGLESGTTTVSTSGFGTTLGSCGLELVFPEGFDRTEDWVIPVPNTRSSSYFQALTNYENTVAGKDITINNTQASPERIAQERARVRQAQLQLESANDSLSKTIVKAPVTGTLSSFEVEEGDFVSQLSPLARVTSIGDLELVAWVNPDEQAYLIPETQAKVGETETRVITVSPTVDADTKKIKVTLEAPEGLNLTEGVQESCAIERTLSDPQLSGFSDLGGITIPLSALSIIGNEAFVFELADGNMVTKTPVVPGALLGDQIIVYGLESDVIIEDARGVRDGEEVLITSE